MAFVQEQMDRSLRIALRKGNIAQQKARPRVASEELFFFSFKRQQEKFNEAGAWKAVFFFFFCTTTTNLLQERDPQTWSNS